MPRPGTTPSIRATLTTTSASPRSMPCWSSTTFPATALSGQSPSLAPQTAAAAAALHPQLLGISRRQWRQSGFADRRSERHQPAGRRQAGADHGRAHRPGRQPDHHHPGRQRLPAQDRRHDVRTPVTQFPGVFAAYLNVNYDSVLATIPQPATFSFDTFFGVARTFDVSSPGFISGAGASATSLTAPGNAPQNLWTVLVHASSCRRRHVHAQLRFHARTRRAAVRPRRRACHQRHRLRRRLAHHHRHAVAIRLRSVPRSKVTPPPPHFVFTVSLSSSSTQQVTVAFNTSSPAAANAASPASTTSPPAAR